MRLTCVGTAGMGCTDGPRGSVAAICTAKCRKTHSNAIRSRQPCRVQPPLRMAIEDLPTRELGGNDC